MNNIYNFHALIHNDSLIHNCENSLNSFIDEEAQIWFEDEEGNCFVPKGKIKIGYYQITPIMCE